MPELLLELLSEEIPARMQERAAADLAELVGRSLKEAELGHDRIDAYATPRRLALHAQGIPAQQPDVMVERRGPRVGAPQAAVDGFIASLGVSDYTLEEREDRKGRVHVARFRRAGQPTPDVLVPLLGAILARFPWQKSMRWGSYGIRWVRPLRGILCVFDGEVVPIEFGPLRAVATTRGHRFLAPATMEVRNFEDYRRKLAAAYVQLDGAERRRVIAAEAARAARAESLRLRDDPTLLTEVAGLVEWPVVLLGRIDHGFMRLPEEILVTAMRQHQRYLALEDSEGRLASRFAVVANLPAKDGGQVIVAGNERVLRARLWDAQFFWDQDRKRPLARRVPELDGVVFHASLGSLGAKAARLEVLGGWVAEWVPGADAELATRAGLLCKSDLVTGMVGEFPELQGIVGRYYANHDRERPEVADAIGEHYAPQGPNERCPSAPVSVAVALADKLDTLVGFFAIDEKPTGSRDPFALRRAALGVIRLILENRVRLPLKAAFEQALAGYGDKLPDVDGDALSSELLAFFADRLKVHLRDVGVRHDLISAVFAAGEEDDLVRLLARVEALRAFLATEDGANLLTALRRASNIVRIEEKRDGLSYAGEPDRQRLQAEEEQVLFFRLMTVGDDIAGALEREAFGEAMAALAGLRQPVDAFFDRVTVNANEPEVRENRLYLLNQIRSALSAVADFSLIEDTVQSEEGNRRVA
ncbi:MAG TPA: glycine--tRNA ligase subunit beta [Geminicoccaceae bacterium]